jgi:Zn ribbon nucleic-acid-binding protein
MLRCPECSTQIDIQNPRNSNILECCGCGIDLEIQGNLILALQLPPCEE